jgi:hypothetical protein
MRRVTFGLLLVALAAGTVVTAGESRTYDSSLSVTWDAAVKTVRDVDFVLVDSDRDDNTFEMRTKSKWTHKRGLHMRVTLSPVGPGTTTIEVVAVNPDKAKRLASRIAAYLESLDRRLD